MIDLATWPFSQPEREQQLLSDALDACPGQERAVLAGFLALDVLAGLLTAPPAWRARWWQVWRPRRP